jgi:hypothetical protein
MNEEARQRIREQLLYEFLNPEQPKKKPNKSPVHLSKKLKFLKNPNTKRDPFEKRQ